MAELNQKHGCPRCAELEARVAALETLVAELRAELAKAQAELAKAKKHSGNSSKPPSGDIAGPRRKHSKPGRPKKRKIGGQPGHERHQRTPFSAEELDQEWTWYYCDCPCCGGKLVDVAQPPRILQHVELSDMPVTIEQHTAPAQWCSHCQRTFAPSFPDELRKAGLMGPRLTALVGFLKGPCHMSFSVHSAA